MADGVAIIGGTGLYDPGLAGGREDKTVSTPYGQLTVTVGDHHGVAVGFLARHGADHRVPPHQLRFRPGRSPTRRWLR
ncbi:MAG: hypothetical protein AB1816_07655 [Bacillota bacterium]|nr:hypothetical protein [Bacillota bacterium]MDI7249843.1 hypothetical protein [Bacillota bacterium]